MSYPSDTIQSPMAMRFLAALEEAGVLEFLRENRDGLTNEQISERLSLDRKILGPVCDFVALNLPEILTKSDDCYTLKSMSDSVLNRVNFLLAYEPVFCNLPRLLRGQAAYGVDVIRRGQYLQKSSSLHNKASWEDIVDFLKAGAYDFVIDLGCGSGDFLIYAVQAVPGLAGIGIEADKETAAFAQKNIVLNRMTGRIKIVAEDARNPEVIAKIAGGTNIPIKSCIVGVTIWHEFLINGEHFLSELLQRYRKCFPGSALVIVEYNGLSYENLAILPQPERTRASLYHLVHYLTNQGAPQPLHFWKRLISGSGFTLARAKPGSNNLTSYFCLPRL